MDGAGFGGAVLLTDAAAGAAVFDDVDLIVVAEFNGIVADGAHVDAGGAVVAEVA